MRRSVLTASFLLLSSLALGCSDIGTHSLAIEGSERVIAGVTTADMWTVSFDQLVVVVHNPGLVERTDNEPAWIREPGVTVWDVTEPLAEGEALSRKIRATRYDGADFRIAPASESGYDAEAGNVEASVVDAAVDDGWSMHVVGSATDGVTTISFDWTFETNTFYRCKFDGDAVVELGADGDETTVIEILGEALIGENFQAIADADGNGDGAVTQEELASAGLWDAIETASATVGAVRGAGACPVVEE
ncbi:MAG TPA: hypothetical protein VM869_18170 [Enhygromyxa sp.]|nr:hypothetical protein [Enhygromyxa sp.]